MHASTEVPLIASPEPIGLRRIRLAQAAGASAVAGELRAADQVLVRRVDRVPCSGRKRLERRRFTFEITFGDGYTFCGCDEFGQGARRRPSLTHVVRGIFSATAAPQADSDCGPVDLSRYTVDAN